MPHKNKTLTIQGKGRFQAANVANASNDIVKRARPAAALLAHPAILDVPHGKAGHGQRSAEGIGVVEAVPRPPVAAVNKDDHRTSLLTCRQPEIAELIRVRPVPDPLACPRCMIAQSNTDSSMERKSGGYRRGVDLRSIYRAG